MKEKKVITASSSWMWRWSLWPHTRWPEPTAGHCHYTDNITVCPFALETPQFYPQAISEKTIITVVAGPKSDANISTYYWATDFPVFNIYLQYLQYYLWLMSLEKVVTLHKVYSQQVRPSHLRGFLDGCLVCKQQRRVRGDALECGDRTSSTYCSNTWSTKEQGWAALTKPTTTQLYETSQNKTFLSKCSHYYQHNTGSGWRWWLYWRDTIIIKSKTNAL